MFKTLGAHGSVSKCCWTNPGKTGFSLVNIIKDLYLQFEKNILSGNLVKNICLPDQMSGKNLLKSCHGIWCLAAGLNLETGQLSCRYSWYNAECNVKSQPNDRE